MLKSILFFSTIKKTKLYGAPDKTEEGTEYIVFHKAHQQPNLYFNVYIKQRLTVKKRSDV